MSVSEKNKEVKLQTSEITIYENALLYEDAVIQLSNISQIKIGPMPRKSYQAWAIVGAIVGAVIFLTSISENFKLALIGLIVAGFCAYMLYSVYDTNRNLGEYLMLSLNCGTDLLFSCDNPKFLRDIRDVMMECFNKKGIYKINFKNNKINYIKDSNLVNGNINNIKDSNIVHGDGNTVDSYK